MTHQLVFAARSDRGLIRSSNQDSVYAGNTLLVVADGMGGHAAGDMASRLVVSVVPAAGLTASRRRPVARPGQGHPRRQRRDRRGGARQPRARRHGHHGHRPAVRRRPAGVAHVGDSRAYLYRDGVLHQLTHDDTFVQSLIDDGRITQEEAAHHPQRSLLLRALNGTDVDPSLTIREVSVGDRYLICCDGLPGVVSAEAIADALANPDPDAAADALDPARAGRRRPGQHHGHRRRRRRHRRRHRPDRRRTASADPDATGPIGIVELRPDDAGDAAGAAARASRRTRPAQPRVRRRGLERRRRRRPRPRRPPIRSRVSGPPAAPPSPRHPDHRARASSRWAWSP